MKNIALIKSIVATSISSANPAELTEHIAALIQAHPEETRENALAILYTRTETRWYKTEEDANAGRNGSYNHDDYVIAREKAYKDSTSVAFDIREWNTGKVVWKR